MDAEEVSLATQPQTAAVRLSARLRGGPSELISTGLQRTGQVSRCSVSVCCDRPQNTPNVATPSPRQRPTGDASAREERGISGKRESTPSQHFHRGFKKKEDLSDGILEIAHTLTFSEMGQKQKQINLEAIGCI